jgi:hypothetical protein
MIVLATFAAAGAASCLVPVTFIGLEVRLVLRVASLLESGWLTGLWGGGASTAIGVALSIVRNRSTVQGLTDGRAANTYRYGVV